MALLTIVVLVGILTYGISIVGPKGLAVIVKSAERKWKK